MPSTKEQDDWVRTVLGIVADAGPGPDHPLRIWKNTRSIWSRASDDADAQLAALQAAMRASDDEDYQAIAELGLNAVTGNHKVRLMAGLMEIDRAGGQAERTQVAGLRRLIDAFVEHLASDPHVDAVDSNELGVSVHIADTLIPALEELDDALILLERAAA